MSSVEDGNNELASPWIAHVLVAVIILALALVLYLRLFVLAADETYSFPLYAGLPTALAVFWLVGWMAADVIGGRRTSNRAAWLFVILCLPIIGALIYYFTRWLPAKRNAPDSLR